MAVMLGNLYARLSRPERRELRGPAGGRGGRGGFESRLSGIESKVSLLQWMVGFNLALTLGIAIKLSVP